jgi:RNA polymerase sigma-70 factor (ECF subfamily)
MDESKGVSGNVPNPMAAASATPPALDQWDRSVVWSQYLADVAGGSQSALAKLYDESSSLVYSLALRILGDVADAEEVTLDVYTQVWRSASAFDGTRGRAASWLSMLVRSRAIDRLRSTAGRRQKEESVEEFPFAASAEQLPETASIQNEIRRQVRAALAQLSPEQRQAIELAFYSGLSHAELAEKLGQPLGTVKTRIRLGMLKLRQLLGPVWEAQ